MLGSSEAELHVAKQRVDVLTEHLQGADVPFMVQEDPLLMFEDLEPSKAPFFCRCRWFHVNRLLCVKGSTQH
jgi:hypothetical protein